MKNGMAALLALSLLGSGPANAGAAPLNDDDTRAHARAAKDFENSARASGTVSAGPGRRHHKKKRIKTNSSLAKENSPAKTSPVGSSATLRAEAAEPPSPDEPEDSAGGDAGKKVAFCLWMALFIGAGAFGGAAVLGGSMLMTMMGVSLGGAAGAAAGYATSAFADLDNL